MQRYDRATAHVLPTTLFSSSTSMDFVQTLDPSKLVLFSTAFSFLLSGFASPPYNLPVFLFGIYALENSEAFMSLQTFTGLLGASFLYDVVWMMRNNQHGFIKFLSILLLLAKIPTFFAFALAARQRGAQFGGLGVRGNDLGGPTVWAMPGGFTSGGGYQTVDDEPPAQPAPQRAAAPPPPATQRAAAPPAPPAAPAAYQTV
ncbi:hypothetical protein D9757_002929 [Collybiopsis confluens]|uniref:Uncharacterized protein n=1 Tax=Collybiopsis confluens TaxID=2823264 RepID=A0A8H5HV51_9AGAR|nr:hypothetical protein D9757_002929 [Collybiopsis confluens]